MRRDDSVASLLRYLSNPLIAALSLAGAELLSELALPMTRTIDGNL